MRHKGIMETIISADSTGNGSGLDVAWGFGINDPTTSQAYGKGLKVTGEESIDRPGHHSIDQCGLIRAA